MTRQAIIPILVLWLAPAAGVAGAEQLVVIDYESIELEPGTVVDSAAPIVLPEGAAVTLMTAGGEVISLIGPHDGPPVAGASETPAKTGLLAAVASLFSAEEDTVTGGFRSGGEAAAVPPGPWLVDPGGGGFHCLPPDAAVSLWRRDAGAEAALEIWGDAGEAAVWWEEGDETAGWPDQLPVADGALYELNWEDSIDSAEISFRVLPAPPPEDAALLVTLIENGCRRQAFDALARLAASAEPGAEP